MDPFLLSVKKKTDKNDRHFLRQKQRLKMLERESPTRDLSCSNLLLKGTLGSISPILLCKRPFHRHKRCNQQPNSTSAHAKKSSMNLWWCKICAWNVVEINPLSQSFKRDFVLKNTILVNFFYMIASWWKRYWNEMQNKSMTHRFLDAFQFIILFLGFGKNGIDFSEKIIIQTWKCY